MTSRTAIDQKRTPRVCSSRRTSFSRSPGKSGPRMITPPLWQITSNALAAKLDAVAWLGSAARPVLICSEIRRGVDEPPYPVCEQTNSYCSG